MGFECVGVVEWAGGCVCLCAKEGWVSPPWEGRLVGGRLVLSGLGGLGASAERERRREREIRLC